MYNGKLIALLLLKSPRWGAIYAFPAVMALLLWTAGIWWWWVYPLVAAPLAWFCVNEDPYEGPILRFPIATYLRSRPRPNREAVEHERAQPPEGPAR